MVDVSPPSPMDVEYRVVRVEEVIFDFATSHALVILREAQGQRRLLSVPVALQDATAIHQAWSRTPGRRPSTSELVAQVLGELQADVIAARIVRVEDGVYFGELDVMTPRGRRVFDCRPSDAVALALRQGVPAPLLVAEELLAQD